MPQQTHPKIEFYVSADQPRIWQIVFYPEANDNSRLTVAEGHLRVVPYVLTSLIMQYAAAGAPKCPPKAGKDLSKLAPNQIRHINGAITDAIRSGDRFLQTLLGESNVAGVRSWLTSQKIGAGHVATLSDRWIGVKATVVLQDPQRPNSRVVQPEYMSAAAATWFASTEDQRARSRPWVNKLKPLIERCILPEQCVRRPRLRPAIERFVANLQRPGQAGAGILQIPDDAPCGIMPA